METKIVLYGGPGELYVRAAGQVGAEYLVKDFRDLFDARLRELGKEHKGGKAMVVDHLPIFAGAIKSVLKSEGMTVYSMSTGKEALDRYPSIQPELALIATRLQDMPGINLARKIKKLKA